MSLRIKAFYNALVGGWGGFIAWAILDLVLKLKLDDPRLDAMLNGAVVGFCVGALVSSFAGLMERRPLLILRGLTIGSILGVLGGVAGLVGGQEIYQLSRLVGDSVATREIFRAVGWAVFGIGVGIAEGLQAFSLRRMVMGGLGGIIGGLIGSASFSAFAVLVNLQMTNRAVGFAMLGAWIGLLAGLVPIVGVSLLRIISARNQGKEFLLDKKINTIGRLDSNDVGLFGDKGIAPKHAEIRKEGGQFVIYAEPGQTVFVNGMPTARAVLQNGAQIGIGAVQMEFRKG